MDMATRVSLIIIIIIGGYTERFCLPISLYIYSLLYVAEPSWSGLHLEERLIFACSVDSHE